MEVKALKNMKPKYYIDKDLLKETKKALKKKKGKSIIIWDESLGNNLKSKSIKQIIKALRSKK